MQQQRWDKIFWISDFEWFKLLIFNQYQFIEDYKHDKQRDGWSDNITCGTGKMCNCRVPTCLELHGAVNPARMFLKSKETCNLPQGVPGE